MGDKNLIKQALEAREKSYSPYSHFRVGAAILTEDGKLYTGCNIENAAFSPTNCAERTAIFKAVSDGKQKFVKIAIVGGKEGETIDYCPPCGVCRQVLREFVNPQQFQVILAKSETEYKVYTLSQLLPEDFGPNNI
ncbi:MAG: cytidine deaminase [Lachnospiraceae bacterium]|nr:cytidine deaminase [Lachnospiraceae bacterium]